MDRDYCLILANGPWPVTEKVRQLSHDAVEVVACDGALDRGLRHELSIDVAIGDMDSVDQKNLELFSTKGGKVIENQDQHSNDLAKALEYCMMSGRKNTIIIGALGGDVGHEWANILSCISSGISVELIGKKTRIRTFSKGIRHSIEIGTGNTFSLFAIPFCDGVELSGARYELMDERLDMGSQGLHNVATRTNIEFSFQDGSLVLISSLNDQNSSASDS